MKRKNSNHPASNATAVVPLLALFLIMGLMVATHLRNRVYQTPVALWRSMAEASPNKRRTHENFGQSLSTAGKLEEALREFKTVMALPDDGSVPMRDLYREIGVVYFRLNMLEEAILSWKQGLTFAPFDPSLMNNLAVAFMRKGQYDEAAKYADMGLKGNPQMPTLWNTMGEVAMHKGEFDKAATYFAKALDLNPGDPSSTWNAALACERAGQYERSTEYANRFLALAPDPRNRQNAMALLDHLNRKMNTSVPPGPRRAAP